ncbi:MAG: (d)CMP kinase [Opitutaceae bacterium]|nr:(d)CMP kinase [Opitutaceae bacterium]
MSQPSFIVVAIDGGAASGKSSTSRALSARFHLLHVDTGSFYRAITAELLRQGVPASDVASVRTALSSLRFGTRISGRSAAMEINGREVDPVEIRGPAVNAAVSHFAAIPEVRAALLDYQRGQRQVALDSGFNGLVMEGRDIGSVIFPDADFRFFLFADPEERARRRAQEGQQDSIADRDRMDTQRKTAPLACPPGATPVDSTHLTLEQVVDLLSDAIAKRIPFK